MSKKNYMKWGKSVQATLAAVKNWLQECPDAKAVEGDLWHLTRLEQEALAVDSDSTLYRALVSVHDNIVLADWTACGWPLSDMQKNTQNRLAMELVALTETFIRWRTPPLSSRLSNTSFTPSSCQINASV